MSIAKSSVIANEVATIALTFFLIILIVFLSPRFTEKYRKASIYTQTFVSGTVVEIVEDNTEADPFVDGRFSGNQKIKVRINEGEYKGQIFSSTNTLGSLRSAVAYEGLTAIFTIRLDKNNEPVVWLYNYNREPYSYALVIIMFVFVLVIGKFKGLKSLLALVFTAVVLLYIVVPCMWSPYPKIVALLSLFVICLVSFALIAGRTKKALAASLGTLIGILLAGIITGIFGKLMNLSGVDMEKGESLLYIAQSRDFKLTSLLFVSILISCLGATMDIAVSIASSAEQLQSANPSMTRRNFFSSIMAVGRDIIGTMTNTLILAFCGSALPLAMMIWGYNMTYVQFINIPLIQIHILQALAGSIGMVLSVVFTATISVLIFKGGFSFGKKQNRS